MKIISVYPGHDTSLAGYDTETKQLVVIEFEKHLGIKHYNVSKDAGDVISDLTMCLKRLNEHFPSDNWDIFLSGSYDKVDIAPDLVGNVVGLDAITVDHHTAHAFAAASSSPFDDAIIFTNDGGGDGRYSSLWTMQDGRISEIHRPVMRLWPCFKYNRTGQLLSMVRRTTGNSLDVAGKVMGLSAYGNPESQDGVNLRLDCIDGGWNRTFPWAVPAIEMFHRDRLGTHKIIQDNFNGDVLEYFEVAAAPCTLSEQQQMDIAASMQLYFTDAVIMNLYRVIGEHENVIMSGGGALNIISNQHVVEEMGKNVYAPCNPDDSGLAVGQICYYLHEHGMDWRLSDYSKCGTRITDSFQKYAEEYQPTRVNTEKIADMLREGTILGMVQGTHELGKRALGRRSILAHAVFPDMKERINDIKRREHYRPFAPMCLSAVADTYFDMKQDNDLYSYMNIGVNVKEEYKDLLSCITHVDGTARLQTVKYEDDPLIHDILSKLTHPVLLNTSFNIAGKPILNTIEEALQVLRESSLDCVIVEHNNELWMFEDV